MEDLTYKWDDCSYLHGFVLYSYRDFLEAISFRANLCCLSGIKYFIQIG